MNHEIYKKILDLLVKEFKGEEGEVFQWLVTERREWNGYTPITLINTGNAKGVLRYLQEASDPNADFFVG